MFRNSQTLLYLAIASLWLAIASAQAYFPSEIIQLGADSAYPWGATPNPNIQTKGAKYGIEVNWNLPPFPIDTVCKLELNLPDKWNDNNSTWNAFFEQGSGCVVISIIDGQANPHTDTLENPAPATPYGIMTMSLPEGRNATGLDVTFDPPTIPCCANLLMMPVGEEVYAVSWQQHPDTAEGLEMLAYQPYNVTA